MSETSTEDDLHDLELFHEFAATGKRSVRNRLVERHMGLAAHIAQRYRRSGVTDDDLRQVAMLGLVKAVDRFDPDYGASFSAFAGRTIEGELKRYFRDQTWTVRVPRSAKELHLAVRRASDDLSHQLARSPTVDELAAHLRVDRDDVIRGIAASAAYTVGTLDASGSDDDDAVPTDRRAVLSVDETGYEATDDQLVVGELLERLPERERRIVELRFFDRMSQQEIGALMGVSQMHVSRLLRRSFEQMREWIDDSSVDALQEPSSASSALE